MNLRPGNAQHQGSREAQQDSFGFSDLGDAAFVAHAGVLGMVADGMGGLAHGGAAGAAAVHALLDAYAAKRPSEGVPGALLRALERANDAVVRLARDTNGIGEVGTTAAVAVVHEAALHWIAAGDSRVYLWRAGRLTQVNADHIYAADLDAKIVRGQISEEDARADPDRDALTSHLGTPDVRRIDRSVTPYPLFEGDRVLVCSDGLYRALEPAEIAAPLAGNPQRACEALVTRAVAKGLPRQDNMTVIVIGLDADGVTTATQTGELEPDSAASSEHVRDESGDSWIESGSRLRSGSSEPQTHAIARTVLPAWLMWTLGGATAALTIVALVLAWVIWLGPARDAGTPTTPTPKDAHVPAKEGRS